MICEITNSQTGQTALNIGQLDTMVEEYRRCFEPIDTMLSQESQ